MSLVFGKYNSNAFTLLSGFQRELQLDVNGLLKVGGAGTAGVPAGGVQSVQEVGTLLTVEQAALAILGALSDLPASSGSDASATIPALLRKMTNVVMDTSPVAITGSVSIADVSSGEYELVAASQTAQVLGATGATGDWIQRLIVVPATVAPGVVTLLDNATALISWPGGTVGADLKPFEINVGAKSTSGAWKLTTGANVSVLCVGNFT